jgi:hypothetical protein
VNAIFASFKFRGGAHVLSDSEQHVEYECIASLDAKVRVHADSHCGFLFNCSLRLSLCHDEIKNRLNSGNAYCHSDQNRF